MLAAPALSPFVCEETLPGTRAQSRDELLVYARREGNITQLHPLSSQQNE